MTEPFPCVDPDHFLVNDDGSITPQPWMQWRSVGSVEAPSKSGSYGVTISSGGLGGDGIFSVISNLFGGLFDFLPTIFGGRSPFAIPLAVAQTTSAGGNKNDLLHALQLGWTNNTPVAQWVYGTITRGGARVTLQARSRGGLVVMSGYNLALGDPGKLAPASMFGVGADLARSGTLAIGTSFCVAEQRMNSVTIPLAPERAGWQRVEPGQTITARVELRFVSEFWENTSIDGGDSGSESSYETGATRLDLFAVPVI
ncbi:hypothetical protein PBI_THONKO_37 [Mycobacterium phage Thonko]|uniref:Uncharacterized protein n=1 Tax=Mycobacterium phage Thonko TaxID=2282910 RepID=A0A346FC84_9CAUD|nr:hypothetical protein I5G57_gp037 [Mycobacterium phage Thonko]AXN53309.1 hypothetical protein PBI_THONKO_37 [Mycobacterium phage Thonko]